MRRFAPRFSQTLLLWALVAGAVSHAWAQAPRTAPLPIKPVGRGLFRQNRQAEEQPNPPKPRSPIPTTPPGKQPPPTNSQLPATAEGDKDKLKEPDAVLVQAKRAIEINKLRFLNPEIGHSPWMIMHGALALRQEYQITVGNKSVNALDYITKQNPVYRANLPDPQKPGSPVVRVNNYWFESTAYGGRAQPYIVSFAFEGHTNQFLAILSMSNLPSTYPIVVSDSQRPGATKTITMADMVRHAQMNVYVGNPNEVAWTLWFLANYLEPDAKWTDKNGQPWSMEQLVTVQTNAPLFNGTQDLAPCGGTHGLFALACACNSYQAKFGKMQGAWSAARQKLDSHIELARRMQNRDGSFSSEFFKTTGYTPEMGKRFKSSGHMLEWLMMALPPERLEEQWIRSAVMNVSNDLVRWGNVGLDTPDTGAMYHALHALVLYRNRIEPPSSVPVPERMAELPPEMRNPAPGEKKTTEPPKTPNKEPEATIRLINPAMNKLSPLGSVRPMLRPITDSKGTEPKTPSTRGTPTPPQSSETPEPPPMSEKIAVPAENAPQSTPPSSNTDKPELMKPAPAAKPEPAPSEPNSGEVKQDPLKDEQGAATPVPLFGGNEADNKQPTPEVKDPGEPVPAAEAPDTGPPAPPSLVPPMPEPTPSKSPSSSD